MFIDMFHIQIQLMQRLDQWNEYVGERGIVPAIFLLFDSLIVVSNINIKKLHLNNQQDLYFCN